ncbi:MAG: M20/M25/M40 family metallo-hydrolase [Gemmatimonadaceae bacterium]
MFRSALVLLAIAAASLSAQPPAGAAQPPMGARNRLADPIPPDSYPAHIRRTPATDAVIQRIWDEGMNRSQAMTLAQQLLDPLGQRLTGSPQMEASQDWIVRQYAGWGVSARKERYGTWEGWSRGVTHVDLLAPRVRTLEATALAWSPSTGGRPIEAEVIAPPAGFTTPEQFDAWLPNVRGKIYLMSAARLSCRSPGQWQEFGTPEEIARITAAQQAIQTEWTAMNTAAGGAQRIWRKLKDAGAVGVFAFQFSNYPGIMKVFGSANQGIPAFAIGCEDYGLLMRMVQNGQAPRVRVFTDSERLGERPVFNVVAEIRGSEKPNEYVMLSAHFDSWSAASGATDNGTGTITMLEAVRILRQAYPQPKRTIIVGHWSGEEQGLNGSRAFSEDHPEVVAGLQALWNQDNGTGRVVNMSAGPFPGAAGRIERYLGEIPSEITRWIRWSPTGPQATGGTDHASFVCHRAPGFNLGALSWDYSFTTWHTDRDTFDKVVESDLKNNATLTAMLTYLASEDPERMPREILDPLPAFGQQQTPGVWRDCARATRQTPPPPQ